MAKDDTYKTLKTVVVIALFLATIVGWSLTYAGNRGKLGERVTLVESETNHIKVDVSEIKGSMKEISLEQKRLSDAVIRIEGKLP